MPKEEIIKDKELLDHQHDTLIGPCKTNTNLQIRISNDQQEVSSSTSSSTASSTNVSRTSSISSINEVVVADTFPNTCTTTSSPLSRINVKNVDSNRRRTIYLPDAIDENDNRENKELILEETDRKVELTTTDTDTPSLSYSENKVQTIIRRSDSDLAVQITNITNLSIMSLDLAGLVSKVALETVKMSTRAGLGIVKAVTARTERRNSTRSVGANDSGILDASSYLLHKTLSFTEQIALAGIEFTSETVQYTISTIADSISVIDTLFGTTETAKALTEFVQLVKQEWNAKEEGEESLEDLGSFGAFRVIKVLTAWACLQYVTATRWEMEMGGWKKVKLVELWDLVDDWVEITHDDSIYEEFGWLVEEEDEEMVVISSKSDGNNDGNNIVVGELTQPEHNRLSLPNELYSKRLSELWSDVNKRFSNPYMDEFNDQTEEEKLYSLLHNLKRYSKFSSTAYDVKTAIMNSLPFQRHRTHLHRVTFARVNDLPVESIVHSSHQNPPSSGNHYSPTYYLIRDHSAKSIILALRGTMSIHDLIVDLSCEYEDLILPEDIQSGDLTRYKVHKGMMKVAKALATPGQSGVFEELKRELEQNEDYGLVLIGHSLGAGIASLLALLWASPKTRMTTRWSHLPLGRRVHAYAFATPCVMSAGLSKRAKTLVTSVAYGNDVICRLSIGHVRDLRNMVVYLGSKKTEDDGVQDLTSTIITKVLDYQSRVFSDDERGQAEKKEFEQFFWKMREAVHSRMGAHKLYPAGRLYWIIGKDRIPYCLPSDDDDEENGAHDGHKRLTEHKYNMVEVTDVEKIFSEIWFTPTMSLDHLPTVYGKN
ncbi:5038_t:CDS:2 [Ambispora gerdemannii]|uniref:sn-1-specific diacylglycerol lipase n=1 Tax=Ambispora gerdemannii TaxID=144530 RepID=A0A9N9BGL3_9GLOM|nr:5038_t:CDS:2 [Ambispora gerdemannii]